MQLLLERFMGTGVIAQDADLVHHLQPAVGRQASELILERALVDQLEVHRKTLSRSSPSTGESIPLFSSACVKTIARLAAACSS
jgi:hypothetical protein